MFCLTCFVSSAFLFFVSSELLGEHQIPSTELDIHQNASINPVVPILPPPPNPRQPQGIYSPCQFRGQGIRNFIMVRGLGISIPWGEPRAFDFRKMDEFIGKDVAFVKDWLICQGLENQSMFLKVCFLNFRYFFITCEHISIRDKVNNILSQNYITGMNMTISHFAFKSSLPIFKLMSGVRVIPQK